MRPSKLITAIFFLLFACRAAGAVTQNMRFRQFSVRQGLSESNVTAIAQDRQGFLWIGTKNGLNCFNGYDFKVYRSSSADGNSIAGNCVQCLYVDSRGQIWIGLLGGLVSCYNPETETFRNYECYFSVEESDGDVSAFAEDFNGNIWITVDRRGLVRLNPENGDIIRYEHSAENPSSLSHNAVTDIRRDSSGQMWISSWGGGLDRFDPATGTFRKYAYPGATDTRYSQLKCLCLDVQGDLWIGSTYLGLFCLGTENEQWKRISDRDGLPGNAVTTITQDRDSNIWVGLSNGLAIYSPSAGTLTSVSAADGEYGLLSQEVTCLFCDRDGSMWVGTTGGLHLYNPSVIQFGRLALPDGESHSEYTQSIIKDSKGTVWLRSEDGLFKVQTGRDGKVSKIRSTNAESVGRAMFEDSRHCLWLGSDGFKITRLNLESGKSQEILLPVRNVNSFFEDSDGIIWLATELGLVSYDMNTSRVNPPVFMGSDLIFPADKVYAVQRGREGDLWVGTQGGLKRYSPEGTLRRVYTVNDGSGLSDNSISAMCLGADGTLWVGTASALDRYDLAADTFSSIVRPGETSSFPVMGIVEDYAGRLWITTPSGLLMYEADSGRIRLFDEDDGLPSRVFVRGALCLAGDGEILAGTAAGAVRFRPEDIVMNPSTSAAYIEDFQIFSRHVVPGENSVLKKPVWMTDHIELAHNQSTLSFRFASVNYITPGKVHYAYRLTGVDDRWLYSSPSNRFATYANLSPGDYVFEVKSSDDEGNWSTDVTRLSITIRPPFYRTTLAYILYALLAVGVAIELIRWLRRRNRRAMERVIAAQQHEMDELKLKLFTNISHEFRTSLTLIMGPLQYLLKGDQPEENRTLLNMMYRNSERLRRLVNQLLDFRKVGAGKMEVHSTTQDIVPFVKEVYDTFQYYAGEKKLDYSFHSSVDSLVMSFDKDKLDKMVYNLLSNAFKYTDDGGYVRLGIDAADDKVYISVTDNGTGISKEAQQQLFVRFYQASDDASRYRGGSGLGLNMTSELASAMGGEINVESELGKGSVFTITLPVVTGQEAPEQAVVPELYDSAIEEAPALPQEREKELILVVEDNPDMRTYIGTVVGGEYSIVTASDGQEGLEKAAELMPDIVISDVMMPRIDGLEMFRRLKEDERISHIPVILLTAIQDEKTVADSLQMGIDDYVTKPFSPAILLARISNVLKRRQKMWEEKAYNTNPFVMSITEIISSRISDSALSLESLADQLRMSPTQLTRKTKSLMDITPYSLIIKLRMEQAVRYLKEGDLNISEIAYKCGYQEVSNFSRAFTHFWGESPSQYLKKYR